MSLKTSFAAAESHRLRFLENNSTEALEDAIKLFEDTRNLIRQMSLFSNNESIEDVNTAEIRFLLVDYYLAVLVQQRRVTDRRLMLQQAKELYIIFLQRCLDYGIADQSEKSQMDQVLGPHVAGADDNSSPRDAGQVRADKIKRYKHEKALEERLRASADTDDEELARKTSILVLHISISKTLHDMENLSQELAILELHEETRPSQASGDTLSRPRNVETLDWRLDQRNSSPLDSTGKILRPFVITGNRDRIRRSVFGPDHGLPTMTIDEYLEQERACGGILESAPADQSPAPHGQPSGTAEEESEESARQKAISWDDFTENNAKGAGNTMNRG